MAQSVKKSKRTLRDPIKDLLDNIKAAKPLNRGSDTFKIGSLDSWPVVCAMDVLI
jgi:hypothetical protein